MEAHLASQAVECLTKPALSQVLLSTRGDEYHQVCCRMSHFMASSKALQVAEGLPFPNPPTLALRVQNCQLDAA